MNKEQKVGLLVLSVLVGMGSMSMVKKQESLARYHERRDFAKTTEPEGAKKRALKTQKSKSVDKKTKNGIKKRSKKSIFVIQQHAARSLHYDVRLEIDGVLVSWAVPKGPSTDPHDKRLAVETENHPLEYADFEGVIPKGQYGAGEVIVWDRGTYENQKEKTMADCFDDGTIEIFLHGKKLQGGYAFVRMKSGDKNWLLIKMTDEFADARRNPVKTEQQSVLSGSTIAELKKESSKK